MYFLIFIVFILGIGLWRVNYKLNQEMRRNHVLQQFVAGIIRSISDYHSVNDQHRNEEDFPNASPSHLPIPYKVILENIDCEHSKDMLLATYATWLKESRDLFLDDKNHSGDGFNFMWWDYFDDKVRTWHSQELMMPSRKRLLRDDVKVTEQNLKHLEKEISDFRSLMKWRSSYGYTLENIDAKLKSNFPNISETQLHYAKMEILHNLRMFS
jgi:hypothetical protein